MRRVIIILLTLSATLSAAEARQLGGAPRPPSMGGSLSASRSLPSVNVDRTRAGRLVLVPSTPTNLNNLGSRVQNDISAGSAAGLGPNALSNFARSHAN
jgi:hypothetical protein